MIVQNYCFSGKKPYLCMLILHKYGRDESHTAKRSANRLINN